MQVTDAYKVVTLQNSTVCGKLEMKGATKPTRGQDIEIVILIFL